MTIESILPLLVAVGVGLVVGVLLANLSRRRAARSDRERADQIETELEQTREELDGHREDVARHFQQTSDLFREMTEQYTLLYAHLATGARAFSTEDAPALGQFDQTLIGGDSPDAATGTEALPESRSAAPPASGNGTGPGASDAS